MTETEILIQQARKRANLKKEQAAQELVDNQIKSVDIKADSAIKLSNEAISSDGMNGKDGVDGMNGKDGKNGSPDTPYEIRDKLSALRGEERLDAKRIKNINEQIDLRITTTGSNDHILMLL